MKLLIRFYVYQFIFTFFIWKSYSHKRYSLSFEGNPNNVYYAAAWSSSTNVVAVGNVVPSAGLISHSSDGGMTWTNLVRTRTSNSIELYDILLQALWSSPGIVPRDRPQGSSPGIVPRDRPKRSSPGIVPRDCPKGFDSRLNNLDDPYPDRAIYEIY